MHGEKERLGSFTFRPSTELVNKMIAVLKRKFKRPIAGVRWFPFGTSWLLQGQIDDVTLAKLTIAEILYRSLCTVVRRELLSALEKSPRPTEVRLPITSNGMFCGDLALEASAGLGPAQWIADRVRRSAASVVVSMLVTEFDTWVQNGCGGKNPFKDSRNDDPCQEWALVMNDKPPHFTGVDFLITNPDYAAEEPQLPPLDEPTK